MAIALTDLAELTVSYGAPAIARVKDPALRALAVATRDADKARALALSEDTRRAARDYTPEQTAAIKSLTGVYWPRSRAVRNTLSQVREVIRRHFDRHDDEIHLFEAEVYDLLYREDRLIRLAALIGRASARVGRFPISLNDQDMRTTRFTRSASWRHFGFKGGRDAATSDVEPAEIVQGAFVRAIENGDAINGVPTYGALFGHVQAERSALTRRANLARAAFMQAALGHVSTAVESWPEMTDKHSMRLLGTRNYATLDDHRLSLAIAHRDAELETIDDTVTHDARTEELARVADAREFHLVIARVLMGGATLAEIADAMNLNVETIKAKAVASRADSLRVIDTGIDHSERSADMHRAAERERDVMTAQTAHAEALRARRVAAETVHYALSR